MRVFVTGATGVIGRRLIPLLLGSGHEVTAVARSPEKSAEFARRGVTPVMLDLFDPDAVRTAVNGHDAVINMATHIPPSSRALLPSAWRENDRLRRDASANLVAAAVAAGAGRFIQESFAPIYADGGDAWIDESSPIRPSRHTRSVLDAEGCAERFTRRGGVGVVLRFALFYGPDSGFAVDAVHLAEKGWAAGLGSASGFVSSVSHDDAAAAVAAALSVSPGIYNVGDDEPLRRREFYDSLGGAVGVSHPKLLPAWIAKVTGSLGDTLSRSLRLSNRKLRESSGWFPRYPSAREGWRMVVDSLHDVDRGAPTAQHAS
jgi:nucleoside-diphosphate-sugar epimerase